MPTTKDDIRAWIKQAPEGATHMIVVTDTFDWEDYPKYVMPGQDIQKAVDSVNGPNMTKAMEVYNLAMDHEAQVTQQGRVLNY